MDKKLCEYGCGKEGIYKMTSGKWCCENHYNKCPHQRKMKGELLKRNGKLKGKEPWNKGKTNIYSIETRNNISESLKGSIPWNKGMVGVYSHETIKKMSNTKKGNIPWNKGKNINDLIYIEKLKKTHRLTIDQIKERYPLFSKIEEMRYNPDKPIEEKEIQVHCKNHECENSKENGGWFTPTYIQLYERTRQIEKEYGNGGCYFYCCDECKIGCPLYNLHSDPYKEETEIPYTAEEYNIWKQVVLEQDNYECQKCEATENLHCHHIHPVKTHPHLALDPTNGIVLCKKCHYEIGHKTGTECSTGNLANINQNGCILGNI